eukprot:1158638-Pelagomonas_calceolata.AAC.6
MRIEGICFASFATNCSLPVAPGLRVTNTRQPGQNSLPPQSCPPLTAKYRIWGCPWLLSSIFSFGAAAAAAAFMSPVMLPHASSATSALGCPCAKRPEWRGSGVGCTCFMGRARLLRGRLSQAGCQLTCARPQKACIVLQPDLIPRKSFKFSSDTGCPKSDLPSRTFVWSFLSNAAYPVCAGIRSGCGVKNRQNACRNGVSRKLSPGLPDLQRWLGTSSGAYSGGSRGRVPENPKIWHENGKSGSQSNPCAIRGCDTFAASNRKHNWLT